MEGLDIPEPKLPRRGAFPSLTFPGFGAAVKAERSTGVDAVGQLFCGGEAERTGAHGEKGKDVFPPGLR